jgi:hypothetical protein
MSISKGRGRWQITCFACGFSGNTPDLVMSLLNITIGEALKKLSGATELIEKAPVDLHPVDYFALICDKCGDARRVTGETYKTPGRAGGLYETTPLQEVCFAESHGWEIGAHAEFALCPSCLTPPIATDIVIAFDGDDAGRAAIMRLAPLFIERENALCPPCLG